MAMYKSDIARKASRAAISGAVAAALGYGLLGVSPSNPIGIPFLGVRVNPLLALGGTVALGQVAGDYASDYAVPLLFGKGYISQASARVAPYVMAGIGGYVSTMAALPSFISPLMVATTGAASSVIGDSFLPQ